ncbi:MAG TPA: nucleotide sugar dehydrogenase, partial [Paraburkholderia sp.]|nr:nucleotide sugar dehydrogenase [Paraburkholderia sp.]
VIGSDSERARKVMAELYAPFVRTEHPILYMDPRSAELTKYAANAMLATRISFMNEMANLAESLGADIEAVRRGIGSDSRIGYSFLYAGCGYGGSCFPKDVKALVKTGEDRGQALPILRAVETVNAAQKRRLAAKIVDRFGSDLSGRTIAVWGLAFKPNTDDMREAPSRAVIAELLARGATVRAHDPVATAEAKRVFALDLAGHPEQLARLTFTDDANDVADDADALVVLTEWKAFKAPDFELLKEKLSTPVVFDGRNLYDPLALAEIGIEYHAIGRASAANAGRAVAGSRAADAADVATEAGANAQAVNR